MDALSMALDSTAFWTLVAQVTGLMMVLSIAAIWIAGIAWVANDVRRRTTDPNIQWLAIGATALLFVPGVILYIAIRPSETLEDRRERYWEMEFLAQQAYATPACPGCQRALRDDFVRCPFCGLSLGDNCAQCERFNRSEWVTCPYCGMARSTALVRPQLKTRRTNARATPAVAVASAANGREPAR